MIFNLLSTSSLLLLAAPLVLLAAVVRLRPRALQTASVRLLLILYLVPAAAPILLSVIWRIPSTRIVIELRGIAFRTTPDGALRERITERTPGSGRLLIGDGGRIHRAGASFGTLLFHSQPAAGAGKKGTVTVEIPPPELRGGLIAVASRGLIGAEPLEDGDRICMQSGCWTYDASHRSFTGGGTTFRIPPRQAKLPGLGWTFPLPWAAPVTATGRTYSIDALANHGGDGQTRFRSFICYSNPGPRLRLVTLDPGVHLLRANKVVVSPTTAQVADGERISVYSLPYDAAGFENSGIVERRSTTCRIGARSFALEFDTPEVHSVTVAELDALRLPAPDDTTKSKIVGLAMGNSQMTDRSLYFTGISEAVALQANSLLQLSRFFPRDFQPSFRIVSPRGGSDATLGHLTWIGATDLAAFRMQVFRPPFLLLLLGVFLQIAKIVSARQAGLTNGQALAAGAVEALVAVRLLVGYRIWAMPPHIVEGGELGIVAWMALPWMFLAASVPLTAVTLQRRSAVAALTNVPWLPAMAGLLFSAVFCARLTSGVRAVVWVCCHLLAVGTAALRTERVRNGSTAFVRRLIDRTKPIASRISVTRSGAIAGRVLSPLHDPQLTPFIVISGFFLFVRFVLLLFGWKESLPFGSARLSLSAAYVPAAAVLQGTFLWTVYRRTVNARRLQGKDLLAALTMAVLVWILPAAITSDVGLALLNLPVFFFLLAGCVAAAEDRRHLDWRTRKIGLLPAALVCMIIAVVAFAPAWRLVIPLLGNEEKMLDRASDANFARFIHFAEPDRLRELATKRGESLAITSAILQRYVSSGITGRGYGRTVISPQPGDTALRDFAPAVFIAAEWGLAGTLALLLLHLAIFLVGRLGAPWVGATQTIQARSPAGAVAYVAAATIAVASIYMILANHELLLLTGKNVYLLGLDSAGDVIETMALLLVIAYGFAAIRPDDPSARAAAVARRTS
jgi:hypothetical protein